MKLSRLPLAAWLSAFCCVLVPAALAQPIHALPDSDPALRQSLNGEWAFAYVPSIGPENDHLLTASLDGQPGRKSITVPGHWELQGFAEPVYGTKKLPEGTGYYRRSFRVPDSWRDKRVMLHFDGVLYGFEVWVNGTSVGSWDSGYNPATFDITDHLKRDADNQLAVRVTTRGHGWAFDLNDCWALSGIHRDVTLFAVPTTHFTQFTTDTDLAPDGTVALTVTTFANDNRAAAVTGRLLGSDGQPVVQLTFESDKHSAATAKATIPQAKLWTAETPFLYTLELSLSSGHRIVERIGLREVSIEQGVLSLNGRPIKLRGVNHHDLWPDTGRAADEAKLRRDLELIKAANCNFVRTSHYPPHPLLPVLCDELGLYVMDEVPFGFGDEHLKDPAYQAALNRRAEATVRRDRNRPSVIIWSVGNENPNTPLTFAAARRVKELDSSRPVCFPQIGSYFARTWQEIPADAADVYAPHYPSLATVKHYAETLTRPIIFTEYAHALGLATDQVQAQWAVMQASPRIAGGAIWMFQDQGILRRAKAGETPEATHDLGLNVWPDANRYFDHHGNQGMDGLVYSDRSPQVDYWQVRKVYSPVQIAAMPYAAEPGENEIRLWVENRFDFRSLAGITLRWSLDRGKTPVQDGAVKLSAAARSSEAIAIRFALPKDVGADLYALRLQVTDPALGAFYERTVRLVTGHGPAAALASAGTSATLALTENAEAIRVVHPGFSLIVDRRTGETAVADPRGGGLARGFLPHAGRRLTEGEFMRKKAELTWSGSLLRPTAGLQTSVSRQGEAIVVRVTADYARPDAPDQFVRGWHEFTVRPNGAVAIAYDYEAFGKGMLLEAGLAARVPASASEFRWIGAGPYAGYPGKDRLNEFGIYHLGRADLHFQGNRREVDVALLTTPEGAGVALAGSAMEVAVEREGDATILSHNAVVSGRGTKFVAPDNRVDAENHPRIAGEFTLHPLTGRWSDPLLTWFGEPKTPASPFQPYFHSYDQ